MRSMRSQYQGVTEIDTVSFSNQGVPPVSPSSVKLWMRREGMDTENFQIDDLITGVVDEFSRITNRSLISQTVTAVYRSYGRKIHLPYGPVDAVTSVTLLDGKDEEPLPTGEYYLQGDTLTISRLESTGLKVEYTSPGSFPDGIRIALLQAILTNYNDREDHVMGGVTQIPNNSRKKALRYKRY